jgi:chemotaxis protein methyltransferase CheR
MSSVLISELKEADFKKIADILYNFAGIYITESKKELVRTRIAKRMGEINISSFEDYLKLVDEDNKERYMMIDILTTNKTDFFREMEHFKFMRENIFPNYHNKKLTIWSAGCSYGKEPYSIAVEINEYFNGETNKRILATDISKRMIDAAKLGIYDEEDAKEMGEYFHKYFDIYNKSKNLYKVKDVLKNYVSFAVLNLMDSWSMKGLFAIIFCRNVMIYFERATQEKLINRFYDIISCGGYLFVGHSESLNSLNHNYKYIKPAIYRKE